MLPHLRNVKHLRLAPKAISCDPFLNKLKKLKTNAAAGANVSERG